MGKGAYRYNGCYGYLGDDSSFWTQKERWVLSALSNLGVGSSPTKNTANLFKWLLPLHTFADAFFYSQFWATYPQKSSFFKLVKEFEIEVGDRGVNKQALCTNNTTAELCTIWGTPFNLREVENAMRELYESAGKKRNTMLMTRVIQYISLVLGFPCGEFNAAVKTWGTLYANNDGAELINYMPLTNTSAAETLNINRGVMSVEEISIIFNNMSLQNEQLVNLLPDRSFESINGTRTMIEIMLYNANAVMPDGALCSLDVDSKTTEYVAKYSDAYIAFCNFYYKIALEPVEHSGLKTNGKPMRKGKAKAKTVAIAEETAETHPCGTLADGVDKLLGVTSKKPVITSKGIAVSAVTNGGKELSVSPVSEIITESTKPVAEKSSKKAKASDGAKAKKGTVSKEVTCKTKKPAKAEKECTSYSVLDLYATGTPWSYEELAYLVEHQKEDVTAEFIKAKPGAKRSKTDILKKLIQLKQWGITESSMLIRW